MTPIGTARFITLEGIDGSGKTSSIGVIRARLNAHGIAHIHTREPGGSAFGDALRSILLHPGDSAICPDAETLAMFTARAQHLEETIRPALAGGEWVVCDRFTDSTYAYQGGGRGVARARIAALEQWVQDGLQPDLTLLFDLDSAAARTRAGGAQALMPGLDRFHDEADDFQERVRDCYRERQRNEPQRLHLVDGSAAPQQVQAQVVAICDAFIKREGR